MHPTLYMPPLWLFGAPQRKRASPIENADLYEVIMGARSQGSSINSRKTYL